MKILVTGATGLLGRQVYSKFRAVLPHGDSAVGACFRHSAPGCERVDLSDTARLPAFLDRLAPDAIVHCAAERRPDASQRDPEGTRRLNVLATRELARWCAMRHALLVYISTDYVFDGENPPYRPSDPPHPINAYGQSKRDGELAVLEEAPGAIILRVPILYGPCADWAESAVTVLAKNMLAAKDGSSVLSMDDWAVRYPTFTPDVACTIFQIVQRAFAERAFRGIFHWSGGEPFTKYGMAKAMAAIIGFDPRRLAPDANPPAGAPRPRNACLETSALESLGIGCRTPFAEGIAESLRRGEGAAR